MSITDTTFDELQQTLTSAGIEPALERLAVVLREAQRYHELFDVRLMQARLANGLPAIVTYSLDQLPEDQRTRLEDSYLAACREVGHALLAEGNVREAWLYLRPVGEKGAVAAALRDLSPEEHYDTIVELSLYEGICPRLGFELLLEQQGTCNAITTYDTEMGNKPKADRQSVAALLIGRLHSDLLSTLRSEIQRAEGSAPAESTIAELVADRDWLFLNDNYHIDTSHLSSVMRFAVIVDDPAVLDQAIDLSEYGRRLSPPLQYRGEPPFEDLYPASAMYFRALRGIQVDEALPYFEEIAAREAEEGDFGPAEVYVSLLARLGRWEQAIEASSRLIPANARTNGFAPTLLEMAHHGKVYDRLLEITRERGELVKFAAGLVEKHQQGAE